VLYSSFMIFGHRGAGSHEPENTLRAIRWALRNGADGVEVDVRITKDGIPVLIHDESVDRTTNGSGIVKDFLLRDLKRLDAGKGEEIPTLKEAIEVIKHRGKLLLHVKTLEAKEAIHRLIEDSGVAEEVYIWIKENREKLRGGMISWAYTISASPKRMAILGFFKSIGDLLSRREDIFEVHQRGYPVVAVIHPILEKPAERKRLMNLGLDGIVTDKPEAYIKMHREEKGLKY